MGFYTVYLFLSALLSLHGLKNEVYTGLVYTHSAILVIQAMSWLVRCLMLFNIIHSLAYELMRDPKFAFAQRFWIGILSKMLYQKIQRRLQNLAWKFHRREKTSWYFRSALVPLHGLNNEIYTCVACLSVRSVHISTSLCWSTVCHHLRFIWERPLSDKNEPFG